MAKSIQNDVPARLERATWSILSNITQMVNASAVYASQQVCEQYMWVFLFPTCLHDACLLRINITLRSPGWRS